MTYEGRVIHTSPAYLHTVGAQVYPWADKVHCMVGLAYVFNDDREDFLVYMVPGEHDVSFRVHKTPVAVLNGRVGVRLHSLPNPSSDPPVVADEKGRFVIDPAPDD